MKRGSPTGVIAVLTTAFLWGATGLRRRSHRQSGRWPCARQRSASAASCRQPSPPPRSAGNGPTVFAPWDSARRSRSRADLPAGLLQLDASGRCRGRHRRVPRLCPDRFRPGIDFHLDRTVNEVARRARSARAFSEWHRQPVGRTSRRAGSAGCRSLLALPEPRRRRDRFCRRRQRARADTRE